MLLEEFCKVGILEGRACYVILCKTQFWARYYNRKNDIFAFTDVLSLISFLKKSLG